MKPTPPANLLDLDWEGIKTQLLASKPEENCSYMLVINKGEPGEYRTKFVNHSEMMSMINLALEKKRLRVPITL